jgi:Uma2 family endonuclease
MGALRKTRDWQPVTVDEFYALPNDPKHKKVLLIWGELRMMGSPMPRHSALQASLTIALSNHLRSKKSLCRAATEAGIIPDSGQNLNYLQPDVIVTCEKPDPEAKTFKEPLIVIEILSPSNLRDTRAKLSLYIAMASVSEIVFIDSSRLRAEIWRKSNQGEWASDTEIIGRGDVFRLSSIGFETPIEMLYEPTGLS